MTSTGSRIVVVLGMHRSGTSAITRGLQALSLDLGSQLVGPIAGDNEKGFWEDAEINALNDSLLTKVNSGWHRLADFNAALFTEPAFLIEREVGIRLLRTRIQSGRVFAFKDPRTALLLPFWQEVFAESRLAPSYIITIRNPLEVAESLCKRDGFPPMKGLLLWVKYVVAAVRGTQKAARVFVAYDSMLRTPTEELTRIATSLDLSPPGGDSDALKEYAEDFLSLSLRHNIVPDERLADVHEVPPFVSELYALLRNLSRDEIPGVGPRFTRRWNALEKRHAEFFSLMRFVDELESHSAGHLREQSLLRSSLAEALPSKVGFDNLTAERDQYLKVLSAAQAQLAEESARRAEANHKLMQIEERLVCVREELISRQTELEHEQRQRVASDQMLNTLRKAYAAVKNDLASVRRTAEQLTASHRASEVERDRAIAERDLLHVHLQQTEARNEEEIARLYDQILSLTRSNSWRFTAPLRIFRRVVFEDLKDFLFTRSAWAFGWSGSYRTWQDKPSTRYPEALSSETLRVADGLEPLPLRERPAQVRGPQGDRSPEAFVPYRHNHPVSSAVKVIAFYLPQYHPFPENDRWWGKGFTEWTNVTTATPTFLGHYQPHHPMHFGYYDLRVPEVMEGQAALAKEYGIYGFSYYFYWFHGKVLMESPLQRMLANPAVDMPFCLTWANENWTRRWDGREDDILIAQEHGPEDSLAFIRCIDKYFKDDRYMRIDGKPLLIVYRPAIIPDIRETAALWRSEAVRLGFAGIYLVAAQSFGSTDPSEFDFDAAVQFPPHNIPLQEISAEVTLTRHDFTGHVFDYRQIVARAVAQNEPPYRLFRTAMLSWDNTARRRNEATIFHNFSLADYRLWLEHIVTRVRESDKYQSDEKLVFINAWNEWAEGTHLEPDRRYGYGYLQATYDAISSAASPSTLDHLYVSIIVPNYNHEEFLEQRLESIYSQSFRHFEVIILDDASTDGSMEVIRRYEEKFPTRTRVVCNNRNSGSVFSQWLTGLDLARGDLVWIAESDDFADRHFLSHMVSVFAEEAVQLAYGDIQYVDTDGKFVPGISEYLADTGFDQWRQSYRRSAWHDFNGPFGVKNIIANVSGAVFRRPSLSDSERECLTDFKVCGDWYLYSVVAKGGYISFVKEAKSFFRVRQDSTSRKAYGEEWFYREHFKVLSEIRKAYDVSSATIDQHFRRVKALFDIYVHQPRTELDELFPRREILNMEPQFFRVCIATIGFYLGGGEIVPIDLANGLRAEGHSVTFFALGWEQGKFSLEMRNRLRRDIPVCYRQNLQLSFQDLERELGFQILNTHNILVDLFLFDQSYNPQGVWIATQHGSYEASTDYLNDAFVGFLKDSVDHWTVVADKNKEPLVRRGVDAAALTFIPNGVSTRRISFDQSGELSRQTLGIPFGAFVFLIASRGIREKGWAHAIRALELARGRTDRSIYLLLAGEGPEADRLRDVHRGNTHVRFLGFQSDISGLLGVSDAGMLPTFYAGESFPLFVAECLARGIPAIVSDVGESRNMMSNEAGEIAGIIVSPRISDREFEAEIASAMAHLADSKSAYRQACRVASQLGPNFSMAKVVRRYVELFGAVLSGTKRNAEAELSVENRV